MKKTFLILALSIITATLFGQKQNNSTGIPQSVVKAAPHLPTASTQANLKKWVRNYPQEAIKYKESLIQLLQTKNASGNTKEYDDIKSQVMVVNRLIDEEQKAQRVSSQPRATN